MVNSTQDGSPSSGSLIPCAQRSPDNKQNSSTGTQQGTPIHSQSVQSQQLPNMQNATSQQPFASQQANSQPQDVATLQHSAPALQSFQQTPVAHQQQQLLLQPPAPGSHAAHQQQGQPQFVQPRISPQGQPIRQPRQPSQFRQGFNPSAQPFIPAAEAQQNPVPNTHEPRIPKSADGQGVKNSSTTDKTCFRCKQPGHLKKDCPEQSYCSRCRTRGHIPVKCPLKKQGNKQQDKDVKVTKGQVKDMKITEKTGRRHKISTSFQIQITNVSTAQATTELMTAP